MPKPIPMFVKMLGIVVDASSEEDVIRATKLAEKVKHFTQAQKASRADMTIMVGILAAALARDFMTRDARGEFDEEHKA